MKVYRLERNGIGPCTQRVQNSGSELTVKVNFPDSKWSVYKGETLDMFKYGCLSMLELYKYFGKWFEPLINQGFEVKVLDIERQDIRFSQNTNEVAYIRSKYESI